ncbi:hypothetical protein H9636_07245 [Ureibacillus sp. Re31]|uniref:Uncharacterized protein n=1 Tax=Ureibacillus galli TaxID=2762222 RepID=A0ABR8XAU9_9BACL|nr:hypothetical protein [Ureibacillus galli]MBD8026453.1 hypothetical protein [Ureibacillus galli]
MGFHREVGEIIMPVEIETFKPVAKCHYKQCDEVLYKGEGYVFDGDVYCSTGCIGEQLIEVGEVVEAVEVA